MSEIGVLSTAHIGRQRTQYESNKFSYSLSTVLLSASEVCVSYSLSMRETLLKQNIRKGSSEVDYNIK